MRTLKKNRNFPIIKKTVGKAEIGGERNLEPIGTVDQHTTEALNRIRIKRGKRDTKRMRGQKGKGERHT